MKLKLCKNCRHLHNKEPHSERASIWYNHLCLASPKTPEERSRNTYDGTWDDDAHHYCRDVNTAGHCPLFQER